MNEFARKLSPRYATALHRFLACQEEELLQQAYELGRSAVANGLGILDMARIHQETLMILMSRAIFQATHKQTLQAAETFFFETLSPFEVTHRGFREANARMQQLIQTLEERNRELAQEVIERKRTEMALRESEESLRHLSNKILHVQEEERTRISRELHDEVGQSLTAVNVNLAMLKKNGASDDRKLADAQKLLESTMEVVHHFARELRPAMLDDLGLLPALRSYTKSFAERTGIRVRFRACPSAEQLDRDGKTVVFRVTQESLTNVSKHAKASRVDVMMQQNDNGFCLTVKDNGKAFSVGQTKAKKRLGLLGMQERVRLVNGQFAIESKPGKGTTVSVEIPFKSG